MTIADLDENSQRFLTMVYDRTKGDPSVEISMYQVGDAMGIDKDAASKTAESLMGNGLLEIKTLSGGIGITPNGVMKIAELSGGTSTPDEIPSSLSGSVTLSQADEHIIESVLTNLKQHIKDLNLGFDDLADFIIDIKTIEIQKTSGTPKTAIIRECINSIIRRLEKTDNSDVLKQVKKLVE